MKALHIILIGISLLSISVRSYSQINKIQDSTIYKAELFGSAATGSNTRSGWSATAMELFRWMQETGFECRSFS